MIPAGPAEEKRPAKVALAFEKRGKLTWRHTAGKLTITVPSVHIHEAVVVQ